MRDDRARIIDMMGAIASIEKYALLGKDRFFEDELIRTYIIHHLQVLGEAANKGECENANRPCVLLGHIELPLDIMRVKDEPATNSAPA